MNILGILVIYDPACYSKAEYVFRNMLSRCSDLHDICICSNNPELANGVVHGSNKAAEFSGWDEAASLYCIEEYDVIIMANDTFCTRRDFGDAHINSFCRLVVEAKKKHKYYIIGEIDYSINYKRMIKMRKFMLRWVRTSIFAISPITLSEINGVGISLSDLDSLISIKSDSSLSYARSISPLIKERINKWLFSKDPKKGWYKSRLVSIDLLCLKAKCILQELELSIRCEQAGATFIQLNNISWLRSIMFKALYNLQQILRH